MPHSTPVAENGEYHPALLVLADIRGLSRYTRASRTAAVHGRGILAELLAQLKASVRAPFHLARVEEDGLCLVVDLAAGKEVLQGLHGRLSQFLDRFVEHQQRLASANTCPCEACKAVPRVRLKVLVHCGPVLLRRQRGGMEATGADVNLAYRLRDNDLHAQSHLLLTGAAWEVLGPAEDFDPVELGTAAGEVTDGFLRMQEPAENRQAASSWARLSLVIRKATWEFRFQQQADPG